MEMMAEMYRETQDQDKDRDRQHISGQDNSTSPYPPEIMEIMKNVKYRSVYIPCKIIINIYFMF